MTDALDDLSKGELRRLMQHLGEAMDRLDRAREILDEHDAVDDWDGKPGFLSDHIDAQMRVDNCHTTVSREYTDRRGKR